MSASTQALATGLGTEAAGGVRPESLRIASLVAYEFFAPGFDYDDWQQEALLGAWEAERDHDPSLGGFRPFCYMVVRRRCRDALKKQTRQKSQPPFLQLLEHDAVATPDTSVEVSELMAKIRQLSLLEQRALVGIAYGLGYGELMLIEGCGYKTIDNAVQRARRHLRAA